MTRASDVELSVVVPVYGCAASLDPLCRRVTAALGARGISHQIIFVNDASRDAAAVVLARLSAASSSVQVISLPKNRGQHAAIAEGLARATGRWAAVIDCDLQDPPELLPQMLERAVDHADIVVGRRGAHGQTWWRRAATGVFGMLARRRHGSRLVGTHSVFSVLSRPAIDGYLSRDERTRMYLPVLEVLGLPIASFDYDRTARPQGTSAYGASGLLRRAGRVLTAERLK